MTNFNFITAQETYRALYYQLPKVLFTSPYYKDMSNDSKIAYAMLQDRCEASIQNNWVDEQNRVYFIFTRNELMDILGCKENKISKIEERIERIEDLIQEKWDEESSVKKKMFESFDDFNDRQNAIYFKAVEFDRIKSQEIQDLKQQISDLEVRKKQLNEELFAGLDASDDF